VKTPVISSDDAGRYSVRLDDNQLLRSPANTFREAFETWLAAYWVFAIAPPPKLKNTIVFLERVLLGTPGTEKLPTDVNTWASRLKAVTVLSLDIDSAVQFVTGVSTPNTVVI
jgi:hypothetical protein